MPEIKPIRLRRHIRFPDGSSVPAVFLSEVRATEAAVGSASTAALALPTGALLVMVRATQSLWLRFGAVGMGVAAADNNSVLFPAGESPIPVPEVGGTLATHFRAVRAGTVDAQLQLERIDTVDRDVN